MGFTSAGIGRAVMQVLVQQKYSTVGGGTPTDSPTPSYFHSTLNGGTRID